MSKEEMSNVSSMDQLEEISGIDPTNLKICVTMDFLRSFQKKEVDEEMELEMTFQMKMDPPHLNSQLLMMETKRKERKKKKRKEKEKR